jgi:uncharacterized protein (DUF305 family)
MAEPNDEPSPRADDESVAAGGGSRRILQIGALVLAAALCLVTAGVIGNATAGVKSPGDSSVAAGFARDMTDHHAQAVDLATIIGQRTQSAQIRTLATDIALTQTNQMGQMQGWLDQWQLSLGRSGPPMTWMSQHTMDMAHANGTTLPAIDPAQMRLLPDGRMPGLATNAQINQLRTLPVARADILFLQLMIAHHRAGVAMAQMAGALTRVGVVDRLAATMVTGQQAEIAQMTQMLAERGANP